MEETLGKRIVSHRKRLGLTQDALAERLGVTAQAVSKWENDQSCPDITMLPKLAEVFGCSTDELLGLEQRPVHTAEVVTEESESGEGPVENGTWELKWDGGRRATIGMAIWMLLSGFLLLLVRDGGWEASLWDILWTSGLALFGLFGVIYPKFSIFRLFCAILGGHFLCTKVLRAPWESEYLMVLFFLFIGIYLLVKALKKPQNGTFRLFHNGKSLISGNSKSFTYIGNRFECDNSFGEATHLVQTDILEGGTADTSFGSVTLDLRGCREVAEDCRLDLNCSFGELELLVPRRFRVESVESASFGSVDTQGQPDAQAAGLIRARCDVSFGQISIRYV